MKAAAGLSRERAATTAVFLADGLGIGAWAATIPRLAARLHLSDAALSLALLAFAAGAIVAMPLASLLTPRIGTGAATRATVLLFALALVPPALAPSLATLVAAAAVLGAVTGALDVLMNAHASDVEHRLGRPIMSSIHAAFSAGGLLGAGLGAALGAYGSGGLAAAALVAALIGAATWPAIGTGARATGSGLAWPRRATVSLGAVALVSMLCEGAMADWSAIYLASIAGASMTTAAAGYAAFSAAMVIGRLTGDAAVRALGHRRVVRLGGLAAMAGLVLAIAVPPIAAAGFALVGLGLANVVPSAFSAAGKRDGAAGIAAVATLGYAGFLLGPPLIGAFATLAGLGASFAIVAVLAAAVVALAGAMEAA